MGMERTTWTDERIDDVVDHLTQNDTRLDGRVDRVEASIDRLRAEMHQGFRELRMEMASLRRQMVTVVVGVNGLLGAAVLALAIHPF
jgi:hypothetical protein